MVRRLVAIGGFAVAGSLAAALVTAGPALAKGATKAVITGPGLTRPILVGGPGEPGQSGKLATLAEQSGLFTALFGASTSGSETTLHSPPPPAALGQRYTVIYTVPGVDPRPGERYGRIRQNLYPYATDGPLTYSPPGQHGFGEKLQVTGWLRADPELIRTLHELGVPTQSKAPLAQHAAHPRPASPTPDRSGIPGWPIGLAAGLVAAGLAAAALWRHHRKLNTV